MRRRERLRRELWVPVWQDTFEGWTINFIRDNLWKVRPELDFDDLYQECACKFLHCRDTYPDVQSPKHFMALYKRAVTNLVIDTSKKRARRSKVSFLQGVAADIPAPPEPDPDLAMDVQELGVGTLRIFPRTS